MLRLDPILPAQIRKIHFYAEALFGCSVSLTALQVGKRRIIRFALAKAGKILPNMPIEPETVEAADGILCEIPLSEKRFYRLAEKILDCGVEDWKAQYSGSHNCGMWKMELDCGEETRIVSSGKGAYPFEFLTMIQAWDDIIYLNSCLQCMAMEPEDFTRYASAV